jgi:uncharacterized membrane protein
MSLINQQKDTWGEIAKWALFLGSIASSIALGFELWHFYQEKK